MQKDSNIRHFSNVMYVRRMGFEHRQTHMYEVRIFTDMFTCDDNYSCAYRTYMHKCRLDCSHVLFSLRQGFG